MEFINLNTIFAGFIASILWYFVGGFLYFNPYIWKIYTRHEDLPSYKKRKNLPTLLDKVIYWCINIYFFGVFIQCMVFAIVYSFIRTLLPGTIILNTITFGLILIGIKIGPRMIDTWIQTTYPVKLLSIEFINGSIGSFLIAFTLALFL